MLAPSSCTSDPRQYCDNTTGSYGAPTSEAPALFDGAFLGVVASAPACAGDFIGPDAFAVSARYFDVEGDVEPTATDLIVYFEGFSLRAHDVVDVPALGAAGNAGGLRFNVCVPVDAPSVAIELHDRLEHASNGVCITR